MQAGVMRPPNHPIGMFSAAKFSSAGTCVPAPNLQNRAFPKFEPVPAGTLVLDCRFVVEVDACPNN